MQVLARLAAQRMSAGQAEVDHACQVVAADRRGLDQVESVGGDSVQAVVVAVPPVRSCHSCHTAAGHSCCHLKIPAGVSSH